VNRLRNLGCNSSAQRPARRGWARQRGTRQREQAVRQHVVQVSCWIEAQGWTQGKAADFLQLSPRTLRQWQHDLVVQQRPLVALGRPVSRSIAAQRNQVIRLIDELGPAIGLPTLQQCFPAMARAELEELLARYRRVWRKRNQQALRVLHWTRPGSVWAIDFADSPAIIDGRYAHLLAVRDLASGQQLLWLPVEATTSACAAAALAPLFAILGAPLVLKSDNGSAFGAEPVAALLAEFGVVGLFSPPGMPSYNGAVEAGIGSLKTRTEAHASRHGRLYYWTWDDTEAARLEANATARPQGPNGPSPDETWTARRRLGTADRALFRATVARLEPMARREQDQPEVGCLDVMTQRAVDRVAIRRALEEHGYLLYSRRRIPLPIRKKQMAIIP
jgi:transposase InsO family protein